MSKGKHRRRVRSPTPPKPDHHEHESSDDNAAQDNHSQPSFQDYFNRKDSPGKQILRPQGKSALKATKTEAAKEAITLLRRPGSKEGSTASRSGSKGKSSSRKSSSEVKGPSGSRPQLRIIGSVYLVPIGVQDGVDEMKITDEELERLASYQLKVSSSPDGSRLKIDLDWDEDQVLEWLQGLFGQAHEWIADEIAGTDETQWCLFARRKHSKYHIVSVQHPDLACSGSYIYGTLNTGHQASSRIVFVSSIPIPEKVYRAWRTGSARKRAAESEEEDPADVVSDRTPGPSSNRRRRIDHENSEPTSSSRKPSTSSSRHHRTTSSTQPTSSRTRSARKSPIVITSDSEVDLPTVPDPSAAATASTDAVSPQLATLPTQAPPPPAATGDIVPSPQSQTASVPTTGGGPSSLSGLLLSTSGPSIFLPTVHFSDPIEPDIDPYANF